MPTFGICPKCPNGTRNTPLIGGYCHYHFANPNEVQPKTEKVETAKQIAARVTKTLKVWFAEQLKQQPKNCENCDKKIVIPAALPKHSGVAHIVPKASVKSVHTHDANRWFGCIDCHTKYDNCVGTEAESMKVAATCKERYQQFKDEIPQTELRHVPEWLKNN